MERRHIIKWAFVAAAVLSLALIPAAGRAGKKPRDIRYTIPARGDVLFSHTTHAGFSHIPCEYCHRTVDPLLARNAPREKTFSFGNFCRTCHSGQIAFGTGGNCSRCHKSRKPPQGGEETDVHRADAERK